MDNPFGEWWERVASPERDKLQAMARLMGYSFKVWCELAFLGGAGWEKEEVHDGNKCLVCKKMVPEGGGIWTHVIYKAKVVWSGFHRKCFAEIEPEEE